MNGRNKVNQLHSNREVNLRLLLLSVARPTLEYGSEVEGNKSQAAALQSVMLGGVKRILGCWQLEGIWVWKPYTVGGS